VAGVHHGHDHGGGDHGDGGLTEAEHRAMAEALWRQETLRLVTVGIDIGSSTSHLLFARVLFQRQGHRATARFVPVERVVHWRSPIMLTPFRPDGTIDAGQLAAFVSRCYAAAGLAADDVDTGAVILTGEAVKRRNARAVNEIFAGEAGKFVCASAGHRLESTLAAHGSGATALSRARDACGLHVDIGGGTTKLALIDKGEILCGAGHRGRPGPAGRPGHPPADRGATRRPGRGPDRRWPGRRARARAAAHRAAAARPRAGVHHLLRRGRRVPVRPRGRRPRRHSPGPGRRDRPAAGRQ
jgi:hypothetical protein